MDSAKTANIPLDMGYYKNSTQEIERFVNEDSYRSARTQEIEHFVNEDSYISAIGALLYLSVNTRPDISVATSILGRRVSEPYKYDWMQVKRTLKYLKGTIDLHIKLGSVLKTENVLYGYADADWAGDKMDRKSNSGYLFKYRGAVFDWRCKNQTCAALSSAKADFIALSEACQQAVYLKGLFDDFRHTFKRILMYEDNQACLKMLESEKISDRTKHIETKYHFVKDLKQTERISIQYCQSPLMLADFLTKPLGPEKLTTFRKMAGMEVENSSLSRRGVELKIS